MAYNHGNNREWDRGKDWQQGGYNDWNGGGGDWHGGGGGGDWHGGGGGGNHNEWHGGGGGGGNDWHGGRRERDREDEYAGDSKRRKFNDGVRLLSLYQSITASLSYRVTNSKAKVVGDTTRPTSRASRRPSRATMSSSSDSTRTLQRQMYN